MTKLEKPDDAPSERPHIALWPATQRLIDAAKAGDKRARERLGGQASELLEADGPLPEPLRAFAKDALRHKAVKGAQFTGRRPNKATSYLRSQRKAGETPRALWERLGSISTSDEEPIYFDAGRMIETATGREIDFPAFRKRLTRKAASGKSQ